MNDTTTSATSTTATPGLFEAHPELRQKWSEKSSGFNAGLLNQYYACRDRSDLNIDRFEQQTAEIKEIARTYKDIRGSLNVAINLACNAYNTAKSHKRDVRMYDTFYGLIALRKAGADEALSDIKTGIEDLVRAKEHQEPLQSASNKLSVAFDNLEDLLSTLNRQSLRTMRKEHGRLTENAAEEHKLCSDTLMPHIKKQLTSLKAQINAFAPETVVNRDLSAGPLAGDHNFQLRNPGHIVSQGVRTTTLAPAGPEQGGSSLG